MIKPAVVIDENAPKKKNFNEVEKDIKSYTLESYDITRNEDYKSILKQLDLFHKKWKFIEQIINKNLKSLLYFNVKNNPFAKKFKKIEFYYFILF